jgi:hypothetical protein
MSVGEILVIIASALIVAGVIIKSVIDKKKGKSGCSCGSSSCTKSCSNCNKALTNKKQETEVKESGKDL